MPLLYLTLPYLTFLYFTLLYVSLLKANHFLASPDSRGYLISFAHVPLPLSSKSEKMGKIIFKFHHCNLDSTVTPLLAFLSPSSTFRDVCVLLSPLK